MTTSRRPRPWSQCTRRQRGVAVAYILALGSLGSRKNDRARQTGADGQLGPLPSSWPSTSSIIFPAVAAAATADEQSSSDNEIDEETLHRPLNYYELLKLEEPDTHRRKSGTLVNRKKRANHRARIIKDQIKKAYRKQAQKYHPDKANRHNMTTQEATSRFAEIAEAYQTLLDPAQRYEYDWELLEMEEEYEEERQFWEEEQKELKRQRQQQQQQQEQQQQYTGDDASLYDKIRNGASNFHDWKDTFNLDPWAVFEDFFFQDSTTDETNNINPNAEDYSHQQTAQDSNPFKFQSYDAPTQKPPRVSETTMYRGFDASFGADIYTVLRREEYVHDANEEGEYRYQILGQDFISGTRVDPYTGFTMQEYYSAVTEPYFVEEGYSKHEQQQQQQQQQNQDSYRGESRYADADYLYRGQQSEQQEAKPKAPKHRNSQSKLEEGESITPSSMVHEASDPWISPNGKYQVLLTSTCELQILGRDLSDDADDDDDDTVLWSSETYIPDTRAHGCHLTLNSMGRLVLSVDYGSGLHSVGNTVLWNTPSPPVVPHFFQDEDDGNAKQQSVTFRYYASLDDDGVIAVYRVRERVAGCTSDSGSEEKSDIHDSKPHESKKTSQSKLQIRPIINKLGSMYSRISKSSAHQGQTKAGYAWSQLRYSVGRIFSTSWTPSTTTGEGQQDSPSRHECIYSTSPVGCLAPGRHAIHLSKTIARSLKSSFQSMDSRLDNFLSVLTEPASDYDYDYITNNGEFNFPSSLTDDDDEDILDTLLRVTGTAGAHIGKAGIQAAQMGMKRGKKVAGKVVGKMKDRMGKTSVQWGEMMEEKEEVHEFF